MSTLLARHPLLQSLSDDLSTSGKWSAWVAADERIRQYTSLEEALRCGRGGRTDPWYQAVAALTELGSRRGGDDHDAALAVVVLLCDTVGAIARDLKVDADDVITAMWEEVKTATAEQGPMISHYLKKRTRTRIVNQINPPRETVCRPVEAVEEIADRAADQPEDPVADLVDVLAWARGHGVVDDRDVDLVMDLIVADRTPGVDPLAWVAASRGVSSRTLRRHQIDLADRLRRVRKAYLMQIS